jgi:hypothetical protein
MDLTTALFGFEPATTLAATALVAGLLVGLVLDLTGGLALGFEADFALALAAGLEEAFKAGLAACLVDKLETDLGIGFDGVLLKGLANLAMGLVAALGLGFAAAIVFFLPRG